MLDARDRKIIEALRRDAWLSFSRLGEMISLSPSATKRRVDRLITDGLILGASARVADEKLGRALRIFVLIELKDDSSAAIDAFARKLKSHSDVVALRYTAGAYDVLLELRMETMAHYAAFAQRSLNGNPHVRYFKTLTELWRL